MSFSVARLRDNDSKVDWLIRQTHAHEGLAPVDLERFWADQELARRDPFAGDIPQAPLGIMMSGECVYDELGVAEDAWRYDHDDAWRLELNRAYNDRAEQIVGRRRLDESPRDPARQDPPVKGLHDLFEARNVWHGHSWWLMQSARNQDELEALLDRVQRRLAGDLRGFLLPENWESEKSRLVGMGIEPPLYRNQRGPVTFATSIYGVENLIYLILDNPGLAARLRDAILQAMLAIAGVLDEEAGYTPRTAPRGFGFADDNCALLTPQMYEFFGYPILKAVFDRYAPGEKDRRGQHSDSAMGHLLPVLGRLNFTDVNFGPALTVAEIRRHCRQAVIIGQLAPFTFSRNQQEGMVQEFLRDFDMARPQRGLLFATAGSINNGSRLTGMRLIMSAIQHFGRFDR
jgi:uroporphyrinogen decarboxylase